MDWDQVWMGLVIGLPSFTLGYLAYKRSRKVDATTAQSGVASDTRAGTAQVIDGLNSIIDNLRTDNKDSREEARLLAAELVGCHHKIRQFIKLFGDINGDTPSDGTPKP